MCSATSALPPSTRSSGPSNLTRRVTSQAAASTSTRRKALRWWSSSKSPAKGVRRRGRAWLAPFLIAVGYFLQQLVNGLELGSLYALAALCYTLIYGIL